MVTRRPLLLVPLLACAVYLVLHELRVTAFAQIELGPLTSRFAHDLLLLVTAAVCLARAVVVRQERTAWLLLGFGVLAWTLGECYYTVVLWDESSPPIPSPADAGYLLFPLATLAGMLVLLHNRASIRPALLVDGAAVALAVSALSAAIVFQSVLAYAEGAPLAVATSLAYPLADLVLVAVGVGALAGTGWRLDRTWALLAVGVLTFWFADSMYLVRTAEGTYESGGWFDAGWWGGLFFIALAAWQRPPARRRRPPDDSPRLIVAPLVAGAIGLELLVYASMGHLNPLAVVLAAASLVFVLIRLTMTFRQNIGMLRASRDEALTDALTGLGNRRALTRELDAVLREVRPESPYLLALFDLDGFKHYNDTFGHPEGDVLLARLAANLKAFLDGRGHAFRMGGDEFCALFELRGEDPTTIVEGAALALSEHGEGFWIGCSYGSIMLPTEATDADEALRIADHRMYAQKHAGRASAVRQVKDVLLAMLDPEAATRAAAAAERAEHAARELGLEPEERQAIRTAAELYDIAGDPLVAARVLDAAPALAPAAALLRATVETQGEMPAAARIVLDARLEAFAR